MYVVHNIYTCMHVHVLVCSHGTMAEGPKFNFHRPSCGQTAVSIKIDTFDNSISWPGAPPYGADKPSIGQPWHGSSNRGQITYQPKN